MFYEQAFSNEEKARILKVKRHINKEDFLISNDISKDFIYLLNFKEFFTLATDLKVCETKPDCNIWFLSEQKSHGWYDTGELPEIYAVECATGKLTDSTADKPGLIRPSVTVDLNKLLNNI